ncbi:MAG: DNA polymerase III subunit delta [Gaiellales bacterium]
MSGELHPVYLIRGSDKPKVDLAARRLKDRFDPGSIDELSAGRGGAGTSGGEVVAALNALGLFGNGERLVVVRGIDAWGAEDVKAVAAYLGQPTPGSVLALVGTPPRAGKLEECCAKAGGVLRYDVPTKSRGRRLDYVAWVQAQFDHEGAEVDREAAGALVAAVGEDTFALRNEVDKLTTWARGGRISSADVIALAADSYETSDFALGDAWGARETAGALEACERLVEHRGADPFLVALRLGGQIARVRTAQALVDGDASTKDVMESLGVKEYPAKKAIGYARSYTREELDEAALALAALDVGLKGGSRLAATLQLERAVLDALRSGA